MTSDSPTSAEHDRGATSSTAAPGSGVSERPPPLSVDSSNPFVYINDQGPDNYNAELALAMASGGGIDLRGFLTAYPPLPWNDPETHARRRASFEHHHQTVRTKAIRSGFTDLPLPEVGVNERHRKPESERIEDTRPLGSDGTERIVRAARAATPRNPLVVAAGGDLCTIADAYLKAPSIADRLVVCLRVEDSIDDPGYNILQSGWSAAIVLRRLSTVLNVGDGAPLLKRRQVSELPREPLREYMLSKKHDAYGNPIFEGEKWDGDSSAILSAAHPDTRTKTRDVRIDGMSQWDGADYDVPDLSFGSGDGRIKAIVEASGYTEAFWEHLGSPSTWGEE